MFGMTEKKSRRLVVRRGRCGVTRRRQGEDKSVNKHLAFRRNKGTRYFMLSMGLPVGSGFNCR